MSSCERPSKSSGRVLVPPSVSKVYSFSTGTQGSSLRCCASSSLRWVSSFSRSSSASRAACHSSRVPILCSLIARLLGRWGLQDRSQYLASATPELLHRQLWQRARGSRSDRSRLCRARWSCLGSRVVRTCLPRALGAVLHALQPRRAQDDDHSRGASSSGRRARLLAPSRGLGPVAPDGRPGTAEIVRCQLAA